MTVPLVEDPPGSGLYSFEAAAGDVCPGEWQRSFDRADIATEVTLQAAAPPELPEPAPVIARGETSQYGIEPYERLDLWTQDREALGWIAGRILATRKPSVSMPRIRSVTLDANGNDPVNSEAIIDLLTMLSLFVPSRYRCRLQTDRGLVFDDNFFAVGVKHTISAEQWTAEISLDRSDPFELLNGTDYRWNVATWDGALWN